LVVDFGTLRIKFKDAIKADALTGLSDLHLLALDEARQGALLFALEAKLR